MISLLVLLGLILIAAGVFVLAQRRDWVIGGVLVIVGVVILLLDVGGVSIR
jgi:hypothetical protein